MGKEEISSLEEAIRLTNPDFTGRIAAEGLFSIQELELLLLYAQRQMETRGRTGCQIAGRCSKLYSGTYDGYSGKIRFSASGVSILSVCDWRGKCTETVFVVQRSI